MRSREVTRHMGDLHTTPIRVPFRPLPRLRGLRARFQWLLLEERQIKGNVNNWVAIANPSRVSWRKFRWPKFLLSLRYRLWLILNCDTSISNKGGEKTRFDECFTFAKRLWDKIYPIFKFIARSWAPYPPSKKALNRRPAAGYESTRKCTLATTTGEGRVISRDEHCLIWLGATV